MSGPQSVGECVWGRRGVCAEAKGLLWLCGAGEVVGVWVVPPAAGRIRRQETWQRCFSPALGLCFLKGNTPPIPIPPERARGGGGSLRGLLLRSCLVRGSCRLFWGGGGPVRNGADANQPKGSPLESQGSDLAKSRLLLQVVSCQLPTPAFLLEAPPALPPSSPESAADSLGCPQEPASLSEERR